jgi:hypothetical protein
MYLWARFGPNERRHQIPSALFSCQKPSHMATTHRTELPIRSAHHSLDPGEVIPSRKVTDKYLIFSVLRPFPSNLIYHSQSPVALQKLLSPLQNKICCPHPNSWPCWPWLPSLLLWPHLLQEIVSLRIETPSQTTVTMGTMGPMGRIVSTTSDLESCKHVDSRTSVLSTSSTATARRLRGVFLLREYVLKSIRYLTF